MTRHKSLSFFLQLDRELYKERNNLYDQNMCRHILFLCGMICLTLARGELFLFVSEYGNGFTLHVDLEVPYLLDLTRNDTHLFAAQYGVNTLYQVSLAEPVTVTEITGPVDATRFDGVRIGPDDRLYANAFNAGEVWRSNVGITAMESTAFLSGLFEPGSLYFTWITPPAPPPPVLGNLTFGSSPALSFTPEAGREYRVQYRDDLLTEAPGSEAGWFAHGDWAPVAPGETLPVPPPASGLRVYRLQMR